MNSDRKDGDIRADIVSAYAELVRSVSKFPTRADLASFGISRDKIRYHFGTVSGLRNATKEKFPELFAGVVSEENFLSEKAVSNLKKQVSKHKRFVITTAINGQEVHQGFLESIKAYCKKNKAKLLILPCHDPAHNLDNEIEWHFDENIKNESFVFSELKLNSNIHISSIRITAKQVNPHTGLNRFVQGEGSAIFGSPKQNLDYIPVSNVKFPHALMSTGAITIANYNTSRGNSLRSAFIAEYDHVVGALIVEIEDDKLYHFRQIQSDEMGGFADLGEYYLANSVKKMTPKLVMGDYHAGQHDETAVSAWIDVIDSLGVDEVFFHDVFNGRSINHHEEHNIIMRAKLSKDNLISLESELEVTGKEIERIVSRKSIKKGIIVKSNHDEFLIRWLQNGKFKYDPVNFAVGCKLASAAVEGKDPLIEGVREYAEMKYSNFKKLVFLNRDQDYKIAGIELGAHGDKGPNGSRGNKKSLESAYGKCVIGHSHTPGILRGVWQVGTTSLFDLEYNIGPSSWMHTSCLVYENGQRQLVNSIEGKWRLKGK